MTRDDAAQLLGLENEAGGGSARRRYEELFNDYQVRLANAPTPALKRKYQETLAQLEGAVAVLAPGGLDAERDLPSRTPPSIVGQRDPEPSAANPTGAVPLAPAHQVPRGILIAFGIASLMAAALTFAGLRWYRADARIAGLEAQIASFERREKTAADEQARWRSILASGPLQVCNRSTGTLKITALMAVYLRPSGERIYVHSGSFGYPEWTIAAGARARMEMIRGRPDDWDGTASVYAVQVSYAGAEPFVVAGLWSDLREGCLNLSLD